MSFELQLLRNPVNVAPTPAQPSQPSADQPQPCGLTQDEIRQIILDLIG